MVAGDRTGRGVLEGGFHLLDVLSRFDGGAGLSELARAAQLPKATTHRLLEQLLELRAVERAGGRYRVGPLMQQLGAAWQPDPELAAAARGPVQTLAARTGTVVGVSVLHRGLAIVATAARGLITDVPLPRRGDILGESTAAVRLHRLIAHPVATDPPAGYGAPEWAAAHRSYARAGSMVVEHEEVVPTISCVALPVRDVDGSAVAVVCALALRRSVPAGVPDLAARAAREITRNLGRVRRPA
jgi:DNA-binding IclR family transcriptional regulator